MKLSHFKQAPDQDQGEGGGIPEVALPECEAEFVSKTGLSFVGCVVMQDGTGEVQSITTPGAVVIEIGSSPGGWAGFFGTVSGFIRSRMPSQTLANNANLGIKA